MTTSRFRPYSVNSNRVWIYSVPSAEPLHNILASYIAETESSYISEIFSHPKKYFLHVPCWTLVITTEHYFAQLLSSMWKYLTYGNNRHITWVVITWPLWCHVLDIPKRTVGGHCHFYSGQTLLEYARNWWTFVASHVAGFVRVASRWRVHVMIKALGCLLDT